MTKPNADLTIELPPEPVAAAEVKPTIKVLEEQGLSAAEIKMAEKQGMVEEKEPVKKAEESTKKPAKEIVEPVKEDVADPEDVRRIIEEGKDSPEILAELKKQGELTPEQESALMGQLTRNGQGLYWSAKKERSRRQQAELTSEHTQVKLKAAEQRADDLQKELEETRKGKPAKTNADDPLGLLDTGEEAAPVDPLDKPLTRRELEKIEAERADKANKDQEERLGKAKELNAALETMEADAQARFHDFNAVADLANDLIKNVDKLIKDPRQNALIKRKVAFFGMAASHGDEVAPDLAYELGKLHPGYKPDATGQDKDGDKDADLNPEETQRALENASRRTSSATVAGGGGRRVVSVNDITLEQAAKLTDRQYADLPITVRKRLLRETNG
jgi:hypothetical protein